MDDALSPSQPGDGSETSLPEILRKLAYTAFIVGGLFVVMEMVLAGRAPPPPEAPTREGAGEDAMRSSEALGWAPVPGESAAFGVPEPTFHNDAGTRNPPFQPKTSGTKRLLTLGDSTVYGVLVADAEVFGAVAARALSEALGLPVEAINGGVPGYSSEQARLLYGASLRETEPDWVVIATLWSDTQNAVVSDRARYVDGRDRVRRALSRLATFRWLERELSDRRDAREVAWTLTPGSGRYRVMPAAYRDNLEALADLAREDGAEPVFLWLPSVRDLREQALEEPRPAYREIMRTVADEQGALWVDGATPFRGGEAGLLLDDVHPSAAGHARLGEVLARAIAGAEVP